tara:strand:+ start:54 stop:311 length:258 start_codon:yes stop_codon:yes gene_type:complete
MSIKLKELLKTKSIKEEKVLAEGFFSKVKAFFGFGNKDVQKLKRDRKFMGHVGKLNGHYENMAKHIEKHYGQKVNFEKFKPSDFR